MRDGNGYKNNYASLDYRFSDYLYSYLKTYDINNKSLKL